MADSQASDGLQSVHILIAAQRQADQIIWDAQDQAAHAAGDAEVHRDKLLAEARAVASRVRFQAAEDADRLLVEARAKAPLEAQARYTYFKALGDAVCAQLSATLAGLSAALSVYETQDAEPEQPEM